MSILYILVNLQSGQHQGKLPHTPLQLGVKCTSVHSHETMDYVVIVETQIRSLKTKQKCKCLFRMITISICAI